MFSESLTIRILGDSSHFDRSLQSVSTRLDRLAAKVGRFGRIPLNINIAPALASLAALNRALDATAGRLRNILTLPQLPGPRQPAVPLVPRQPLPNLFPQPANPGLTPPTRNVTNNRVTNLGGINLNVTRAADVNAIIHDLRSQGFRLRNRRG